MGLTGQPDALAGWRGRIEFPRIQGGDIAEQQYRSLPADLRGISIGGSPTPSLLAATSSPSPRRSGRSPNTAGRGAGGAYTMLSGAVAVPQADRLPEAMSHNRGEVGAQALRPDRRARRWKTSILRLLQKRGWAVVDEAATDVIAGEQAQGFDAPWERPGFVDQIVALQRERQQHPVPPDVQVQFYDRSPFCTLALAQYLRHPVSTALAQEIARVTQRQVYERTVFFVRSMGFIAPTAARRISYQDSLRFEALHEAVYQAHGFETVDVGVAAVRSACCCHRGDDADCAARATQDDE